MLFLPVDLPEDKRLSLAINTLNLDYMTPTVFDMVLCYSPYPALAHLGDVTRHKVLFFFTEHLPSKMSVHAIPPSRLNSVVTEQNSEKEFKMAAPIVT